jgi:predicted NAD-dependent protein-ADP-ribosyltransferase YbiA (DUF1768 family)
MSSITNIIGTKYQSQFDPKILKNFRVDGILYKSIYHYVYSNLVHFDLDKKSLNNANIKDVYTEYLEIETNSRNQIIHEACERAVESRFSSGEAADLLLGTGDSILLYTSDNRELGTGSDMLGKNLYGKMLMNFRTKLRLKREVELNEKEKEKMESKLYKIYGVYLVLLHRLRNELDDLKEYVGLSLDQLVKKVGKQRIFDLTPSPDIIYSMYNKGELEDRDIIDNPRYMVELIRKKYLHKINTEIKHKNEAAIVESFVDWLIEYKSVEYEKEFNRNAIKFEQMKYMTPQQKERIVKLFTAGKLNEDISEQVKERMRVVRALIPQTEIDDAGLFEIPVSQVGVVEQEEKKEEKDTRPEVRIQDSTTYNDYFSKLFVKLMRKKTKREKQIEEEEFKEQHRVEEQRQIEEELEKEFVRQELLKDTTLVDKDKKIKRRKELKITTEPTAALQQPEVARPAVYRPPSTIRFSEDPTRGYFGALSPLALDKTVFYVDDYAYPSIYHYIMTRLFEMLPTVKFMSKAHGYIMSKSDATNVKTYKSFETLDKEYDHIYNIERLLKINSLLEKCLPIVFPSIEKLQEYLGVIDLVYIYNIRDDVILGTSDKNDGNNLYGIELTKFIKANITSKEPIKIPDEYKNSFITKRLEDVCKTINMIINATDSSKKLTGKDIVFIIDILYAPCDEIFKQEYDMDIPDVYKDLIRSYLPEKNVTNSGIEIIYAFVNQVFAKLAEKTDRADVDGYIKSLRAKVLNSNSFSCVGPYKNRNENCLFAAVCKIIEKINMITGKQITSDKLDYIFMLVTDKKEKIDYVDVDDETVPLLRSLLTPYGDSIADDSSTINGFVKEVAKNISNDILIRVVFFGI